MESGNNNDYLSSTPSELTKKESRILWCELTETQVRLDGLEKSVEEILTTIKSVKNESDGLAKSVSNIVSVGETLQKLSSNESSSKIVVNSIEYQELMNGVERLIQTAVLPTLEDSINASMKRIEDSYAKRNSIIEKAVKDVDVSTYKLAKTLDDFTDKAKWYKSELIEKISDFSGATNSISYLTDFLQQFLLEMKMIYPKIDKDNSLYINYITDAPDKSEVVIRKISEMEEGKERARRLAEKKKNNSPVSSKTVKKLKKSGRKIPIKQKDIKESENKGFIGRIMYIFKKQKKVIKNENK